MQRQAEAAVCPVSAWYEFGRQSVQSALPAAGLYLPATHAEHVPPSGPEKPATHTQSVTASLSVAEYLPALQSTQTLAVVAPVVEEYLPSPQSAQAFEMVVLRVSTAARKETQLNHARTLILM